MNESGYAHLLLAEDASMRGQCSLYTTQCSSKGGVAPLHRNMECTAVCRRKEIVVEYILSFHFSQGISNNPATHIDL